MFGLFEPMKAGKAEGARVAFVGPDGGDWMRESLERAVLSARKSLARAGVEKGLRIGLVMETEPEAIAAFMALLGLGATVVPVRGGYGVASPRRKVRCLRPAIQVGGISRLVTPLRDAGSWRDAAAEHDVDVELLHVSPLSPTVIDDRTGAAASWQEPDPDGIALLQFSSGSTSEPKGLEISLRGLVSNAAGVADRIGIGSEDSFVSWLPLSHDMGLISLLCMISQGVDVAMMSPLEFVRNPLGWLDEMASRGATLSVAPQFAIRMCLRQLRSRADRPIGDLSSLRYLMNGGEPVHVESCREFEERLASAGLRRNVVQPAYGLAENTCAVSVRPCMASWKELVVSRASLAPGRRVEIAPPGRETASLVGTGPPIHGTEVAIGCFDGTPFEEGVVGEILVRGESACVGFVTAQGRHNQEVGSWVRTGDIGVVLAGEIFVVGRTKEMIKVAGEFVAPSDIEVLISDEFGIESGKVAAFGAEDNAKGERIVVVVELAAESQPTGSLAEEIRLLCLRELHVRVAEVIAVKAGRILRTDSGKIKRLALRKSYESGQLYPRERG